MSSSKPCAKIGCGELVPRRTRYCSVHQAEFAASQANNWDKNPSKRKQYGYNKRWPKIRRNVMVRDNGLCQVCKAEGIYQQGSEVDHIVPVSQGGSDAYSNLQVICVPHHREKTHRESRQGKASKATARPVGRSA